MAQISFSQFMKHVDNVIIAKSGMGVYDFADATWRDLYDDSNGEATDEEICETLADYDDIFCQMLELGGVA